MHWSPNARIEANREHQTRWMLSSGCADARDDTMAFSRHAREQVACKTAFKAALRIGGE
jgi:hypothetical protein